MNIVSSIYYTPYEKLLKNGISFSDYSKGKNYYTQLAPLFDAMNSREEYTKSEVDFLISVTNDLVKKPKTFLDIACGTGRHLKDITQRGYETFGVDASAELLSIARKTSPDTIFFESDMRRFNVEKQADCVYSLWDSYVYLSSQQDITAFARQCSAHMKRGGILILDSKNYEKPRAEVKLDQKVNHAKSLEVETVVRRKSYAEDRVYEAIFMSIIRDTKTGEAHVVVDQTLARMYALAELEELLRPQKLRLVECYGNFDKSKYTVSTSDRMIAVFQKY